MPTFQLFIDNDYTNIVSYIWYETRGAGDFTGLTRDFTINIEKTGVQVNGIAKSIYESKDDTIIVQKRLTRWQSALTL